MLESLGYQKLFNMDVFSHAERVHLGKVIAETYQNGLKRKLEVEDFQRQAKRRKINAESVEELKKKVKDREKEVGALK